LTVINLQEATMSRIQLALNVSNLDEAIDFYSTLFRATPAKICPGYANFAIDEPPLKLVLIEGVGESGSINHLGVEVFSTEEVDEATNYLSAAGLETDVEEQTTCCYAVQDKVWVSGPDGNRWEVYTVLADAPESTSIGSTPDSATSCCADAGASEVVAAASCC
jgi:catechol 2,3-dioxygenase-like lactoylglutathione lyase family enzyme